MNITTPKITQEHVIDAMLLRAPLLNELAVEILDAVSLVHYQKPPVAIHQMTLVPHTYLIASHHRRKSVQLHVHVQHHIHDRGERKAVDYY